MSAMLDLVSRAKRDGDHAAIAQAIPYAVWLGIGTELVSGELLSRMTFSDKLVGNPALPALHGGTLGALLESAAVFTVLWEADLIVLPKTINITVDYLRSGKAADAWARAVITKRGRRVFNVHAEAWQDDPSRPIATANAHFLVMTSEG
jgi:acyl-coenzyme A thioesterase PaaI-like protein